MIDIDLYAGTALSDVAGVNEPRSSSPSFPSEYDDVFRIYFYPDVYDEGRFQVFDSYVKFLEFCDRKGYVIPDSLEWRMCYMDELHCTCCDLQGFGIKSVVGDATYKDMLDLTHF